jgi:hypothetical membrane protein
MLQPRVLAVLGLFAGLLFWACVFGFAALRPDYSHLNDAVSELGSVDAPRKWAFNLLGYVTPGVLTAVCGFALARIVAPRAAISPALLAIAGLGLAIAGVFPADMADMQARTTVLHVVGVTTGLLWPPTALWLAFRGRRDRPAFALATLLCVVAMLATYGLYVVFPTYPGAVQRLTFAAWLIWYPIAGAALAGGPRG